MLVRRSMKNHFWSEFNEDLLHPGSIQNITNQGNNPLSVLQPDQLLLDLKHIRFRPVHQQQQFAVVADDLPAQFAADAAAGTRHQHHPVLQGKLNILGFQFNFFPAEQILNFHIPQLAHPNLAQSQLIQRGNGFTGQIHRAHQTDNFSNAFGRRRGHRNDRLLDAEFPDHFRQQFRRTKHRNVMHAGIPLSRIIVKESYGNQTRAGFEGQLLGQHRAGITRSENDHAPLLPAVPFSCDPRRLLETAEGQTNSR